MKKTHLIIHHTAVSREKNMNQAQAVDNYHKGKGWGGMGYNAIIEPDGTIVQGRSEDLIGAHCYQRGMNVLGLGVCLTGNFDIEKPTEAQMKSLKVYAEDAMKRHGFSKENVEPHRKYATYKSCPGKLFTNQMIKYMLNPKKPVISEWAKEASDWCIETKIVEDWSDPQEPVSLEKMAVMMHRMYKLKK